MDMKLLELPEITVIGKEGLCTKEHNIVSSLWEQANKCFGEVSNIAMRDKDGSITGFWGAMSDETMSFRPWTEGYTRGLYLAGVETEPDREAPEGWVRWILPERTYLCVDIRPEEYGETFRRVLNETLPRMKLKLAGAVCDFTEPKTGQNRLMFPVMKEE